MSRNILDRLLLAGFIGLAVLLYLSTADYSGIAQKTSAKYVRFLAVSFGGLGAIQLLLSLRNRAADERLDLFGRAGRFFGLLAGLVAFALAFEPLGFFIPAAVFIPVIAVLLGYRNPVVIGLSTAGVLAAVWLIFVQLLSVNLPGPSF
ncbi:tripartite tricarboxylate transporter TctB family protein [Paracoccus seriniphilus]|uniref:Putative tricarboxylic transport membrane protein n=1 Tax=Paracoccus seriniphilus TaxID=184748 RepID=A0A239Q135_9RHOB|nr:tripartite tricarboxylate transporter TctB family protein [Paracoccus seriniphilus]WCR15686.1 tripartite tricarboxylate transporter TctB family protein [Paracoccus seriniphilus]SNT75637.1 putative tricarboxylic transport membrane protein [Paracoccus seriniphilus]